MRRRKKNYPFSNANIYPFDQLITETKTDLESKT